MRPRAGSVRSPARRTAASYSRSSRRYGGGSGERGARLPLRPGVVPHGVPVALLQGPARPGVLHDIADLGDVVEPDRVAGAEVRAPVADVRVALRADGPRCRVQELTAPGEPHVPVGRDPVVAR